MKREKGITLIALVVTIVVLIILAAVSISMLTGENGIITQAQNAKDATEQARVEELVDLAVNSLMGKNTGNINEITPEMIAQEVNEMENRDDVYAEGSTFPTNIIFPEEERKVAVDLNGKVENDSMYDADVDETDIAPTDLFDYEIIDETAKIAKITRIKPKYCNMDGYNPDTETYDLENTNGNIVYNDKSFNTLVLPYEVELNGNKYKIIEVHQLRYVDSIETGCTGTLISLRFPQNVYTLVLPNTIEKIYQPSKIYELQNIQSISYLSDNLETVILSNNLNLIGENAFASFDKLTNITIPESVTSIGNGAFEKCSSLTNIKIPEGITSIGDNTFYWSGLTSITIPEGVTSIGEFSFAHSDLESITISKSVTSIGNNAIYVCNNLRTVNYRGTQEQWNAISIGRDNEGLTNATINYNYTGE